MAKPGLLGAQTKLYSDAGRATQQGKIEYMYRPTLIGLSNNSTNSSDTSYNTNINNTNLNIAPTPIPKDKDEAFLAPIVLPSDADAYQANIETGGVGETGDTEPTTTETTAQTTPDTANVVDAPSSVATNDTYLNYLLGQTADLDAAYKAETDRIDAETSDLLAQIETKRQRAVVDADSAYELNKATHGTQAERLASMGLAGSGYSDHLESRAYAASRGEVQSAKASALAAENEVNVNATNQKLAAEMTYQNALRESEAQRAAYIESKFDSLNAGAATGVYSQEQLNAYADYYGFDDSKRDVLSSSANAYQTALAEEKTKDEQTKIDAANLTSYENYQAMRAALRLDADAYSVEDINMAVEKGALTEHDANKLRQDKITETERQTIEMIDGVIKSGDYDAAYETVEDAKELISTDNYQSKNFEIVLAKCKSASTADDVLALEAEIERLAKAGKISGSDIEAGKQYLLANACNVLVGYTHEEGDYFNPESVKIGNTEYTVRAFAGIDGADDGTSKILSSAIGTNPKNGALIELDGTIYMWVELADGIPVATPCWTEVKQKGHEDFYEAYEKACSYQSKPTMPKHQSS